MRALGKSAAAGLTAAALVGAVPVFAGQQGPGRAARTIVVDALADFDEIRLTARRRAAQRAAMKRERGAEPGLARIGEGTQLVRAGESVELVAVL